MNSYKDGKHKMFELMDLRIRQCQGLMKVFCSFDSLVRHCERIQKEKNQTFSQCLEYFYELSSEQRTVKNLLEWDDLQEFMNSCVRSKSDDLASYIVDLCVNDSGVSNNGLKLFASLVVIPTFCDYRLIGAALESEIREYQIYQLHGVHEDRARFFTGYLSSQNQAEESNKFDKNLRGEKNKYERMMLVWETLGKRSGFFADEICLSTEKLMSDYRLICNCGKELVVTAIGPFNAIKKVFSLVEIPDKYDFFYHYFGPGYGDGVSELQYCSSGGNEIKITDN